MVSRSDFNFGFGFGWDDVLCIPGWPRIHCGPDFELSWSFSYQVPWLEGCTTIPGLFFLLLLLIFFCKVWPIGSNLYYWHELRCRIIHLGEGQPTSKHLPKNGDSTSSSSHQLLIVCSSERRSSETLPHMSSIFAWLGLLEITMDAVTSCVQRHVMSRRHYFHQSSHPRSTPPHPHTTPPFPPSHHSSPSTQLLFLSFCKIVSPRLTLYSKQSSSFRLPSAVPPSPT